MCRTPRIFLGFVSVPSSFSCVPYLCHAEVNFWTVVFLSVLFFFSFFFFFSLINTLLFLSSRGKKNTPRNTKGSRKRRCMPTWFFSRPNQIPRCDRFISDMPYPFLVIDTDLYMQLVTGGNHNNTLTLALLFRRYPPEIIGCYLNSCAGMEIPEPEKTGCSTILILILCYLRAPICGKENCI